MSSPLRSFAGLRAAEALDRRALAAEARRAAEDAGREAGALDAEIARLRGALAGETRSGERVSVRELTRAAAWTATVHADLKGAEARRARAADVAERTRARADALDREAMRVTAEAKVADEAAAARAAADRRREADARDEDDREVRR